MNKTCKRYLGHLGGLAHLATPTPESPQGQGSDVVAGGLFQPPWGGGQAPPARWDKQVWFALSLAAWGPGACSPEHPCLGLALGYRSPPCPRTPALKVLQAEPGAPGASLASPGHQLNPSIASLTMGLLETPPETVLGKCPDHKPWLPGLRAASRKVEQAVTLQDVGRSLWQSKPEGPSETSSFFLSTMRMPIAG